MDNPVHINSIDHIIQLFVCCLTSLLLRAVDVSTAPQVSFSTRLFFFFYPTWPIVNPLFVGHLSPAYPLSFSLLFFSIHFVLYHLAHNVLVAIFSTAFLV